MHFCIVLFFVRDHDELISMNIGTDGLPELLQPVGGHILAHGVQARIYLKKGGGETRIAKVDTDLFDILQVHC